MHKLVPDFILEKMRQQQDEGQFQAVCLFVDTSGFTPLTYALMAEDIAGVEVIADVLADVFTPLVKIIYDQGGFVAGFAGDAFKAIFPLASFPDQGATARAVVAAWQIKQHLAQQATIATKFGRFDFAVKVTVAAGDVTWAIWQQDTGDTAVHPPGKQRATYYFEGTALAHCLEADAFAAAGEVILTSAVALALPGTAVMLHPVDAYFRLQAVDHAYLASLPPLVDQRTAVDDSVAAAFFSKELHTLPIRGEFRQIVTLFVNLQSLPRDRDFARMFFHLLNQYGGYLCRVGRIGAQDPGGTLLLFWGAPHSYENNVTRALQFILDLQVAVTQPLKAGVTTNLAYAGFIGAPQREEYTCHGIHVNLAARQMVAAHWGEIWLDEATAQQAEPIFNLFPGDDYQFKGFADKQPIFHLQGQREADAAPFFRGAMVGRQAEMAQLETAVQPLRDGRFGGVVSIMGDVGVGKSRLVHEFLEQSEILETTTYFLCQTDSIMRQSLNPFRYFLRNYFQQSPMVSEEKNKERFDQILDSLIKVTQHEALQSELMRTRSFLGALINLHWPHSLYEQLEPKFRFANTFTALTTLIQAESARQPLLIHLEDAHWLDADSQAFLANLTNQVEDFPFIILVTARPTLEESTTAETVVPKELLRASIQLHLLTETETADLAAERLHGPVSPVLVELLTERSEGNPFFVEQILLFLRENALLKRNGQGWEPIVHGSGVTELPTDIRTIMVSRLDRLPTRVKHTVQTASILGREFSLPILSQMMPSEMRVSTQVRAAETAVIWTALNEESYLFQHILLREAAYEMQLQAQRRHLHQQAALAIETQYSADLSPHYGELAYHYEHALDIEKACHYLKQAGDMAKAAYQNEAALDFYDRLLAHLPTFPATNLNDSTILDKAPGTEFPFPNATATIDTLLEKGKVLNLIGELASAQTALAAALEMATQIQDADRQSLISLALSNILVDLGHDDEGMEYARQALVFYETIGDKSGRVAAIHQIANILNQMGEHEQARTQFHHLLEMPEVANDDAVTAKVLRALGTSYSQKGDYVKAELYYKQAIALSRKNDVPLVLADTLSNLGIVYWYQSKYDQALALVQEAQQLHKAIGHKEGIVNASGNIGAIYFYLGDLDRALVSDMESLKLARELGKKKTIALLLGNIANNYRIKKAYDRALAYYNEAISHFREIKADYFACMVLVYKAKILFLQGAYLAAQQLNNEGMQLAERTNRKDVLFESQIGNVRINNVLGHHATARKQLLAMLAESRALDDEQKGSLHYELWRLDKDRKHGHLALSLWQSVKDDLDPENLERLSELETEFPQI